MLRIVKKAKKLDNTPPKIKKNWLDKFDIRVQNLYINSHIEKQYADRLYAVSNKQRLQPTKEMILLIQREQNGKPIEAIKGCIKLVNGLYLIVNVYLKKSSKDIQMKGLTVLTKKQLDLSNNFRNGNHIEKVVKINIDAMVLKEKFFDYNDYSDIYKDLEWDESQIIPIL